MSYASRWTGRLSVRHDAVMNVQVLTLDGELDAQTAPRVHGSVARAIVKAAPLVLDLRSLRALDPAGVEMLENAVARVHDAGIALVAVRPAALEVRRALKDARIDARVQFAVSVSKAIEAVAPTWNEGRRWTPTASKPIDPDDAAAPPG